jgi:hypothetical protein
MIRQELEAEIMRLKGYREICNLQGRYNHYLLSNIGYGGQSWVTP